MYVTLLNGDTILSTYCGFVPIAGLSETACRAEILPGLTMPSLLSVSQLCNDGCTILFDDNKATVKKEGSIFFQALRNTANNMYELNIINKKPHENDKRKPLHQQPVPSYAHKRGDRFSTQMLFLAAHLDMVQGNQ